MKKEILDGQNFVVAPAFDSFYLVLHPANSTLCDEYFK
jgi:hypothetical protein